MENEEEDSSGSEEVDVERGEGENEERKSIVLQQKKSKLSRLSSFHRLRTAFSSKKIQSDVPSQKQLESWGKGGVSSPRSDASSAASSEDEGCLDQIEKEESLNEPLLAELKIERAEAVMRQETLRYQKKMKAAKKTVDRALASSAKHRSIAFKNEHEFMMFMRYEAGDGSSILRRELHLHDEDDLTIVNRREAAHIYLESGKIPGKFHRLRKTRSFLYAGPKSAKKRNKSKTRGTVAATLDDEIAAVDGELCHEDRSHYLERFLTAFFMAVQGALAGYAAAVASIAYAVEQNEKLVEHYGRVSNLFRRWAFILSCLAFVGALNKFQVAHQDRHAWKHLEPLARIELRTLVAFYFAALVLTLICSNVDVSLSTDFNPDDNPWQERFQKSGLLSLGTWRSATWARFFVAAVGWLLSCRRYDRLADQAEKAHFEIDLLRSAISSASSKISTQEELAKASTPTQVTSGSRRSSFLSTLRQGHNDSTRSSPPDHQQHHPDSATTVSSSKLLRLDHPASSCTSDQTPRQQQESLTTE